jgi:hypothetical protein
MHAKTSLSVMLLAALFAGPAIAASASVEFEKPESFTDAGRPFPGSARLESLPQLREHFVKEIDRRLPAGQKLALWITDVDLAGKFEPWQPASRQVRIVKEIYPPRIELRFRLTGADGTLIKEGIRTLRDTSFLSNSPSDSMDALRYEKAMIDAWLDAEFRR